MLAHYQGDYEAERPLAVASLAAARVADDPLTLARALYIEALSVVTDAPGATARYREVLALCERLGDDAGIAMACNDLGELARGAGALDEACALYERALGVVAGAAATRAASPVRPTISGRRCSLAASSTAPPRCSWSRSTRRGASAIAARTPRPRRAWRRWPPHGRRAQPPRRCTARRRRRSRPARSPSTRSTRRRFALLSRRCARRWATSVSPRRSRAGGRWATTSAGASWSAWSAGAPQPPSGVLTRRELEVVRLIAAGLTNADIAERLVVSEHTVHRHVSNILGKLGVPSRAAAASLAARRGLL